MKRGRGAVSSPSLLLSHSRTLALSHSRTAVLGVSLRCAPGRAARAVGHDTTVPNGAEPTEGRDTIRLCLAPSAFSALRARIPHATATASGPTGPRGPSPPDPLSRTCNRRHPFRCLRCTGEGEIAARDTLSVSHPKFSPSPRGTRGEGAPADSPTPLPPRPRHPSAVSRTHCIKTTCTRSAIRNTGMSHGLRPTRIPSARGTAPRNCGIHMHETLARCDAMGAI
jgi:hypothetical protein